MTRGYPRLQRSDRLGSDRRRRIQAGAVYAWIEKNEYDRAIADYTEAIKLDHGRAEDYRFRGFAWLSKQQHDKAIADYTEAIRLAATFLPTSAGQTHGRPRTSTTRPSPTSARRSDSIPKTIASATSARSCCF